MVRGTASGLELVFAGLPFAEAWTEIAARLSERPEFYRGSAATAVFDAVPTDDELAAVLAVLAEHGIVLAGAYGGEALAATSERFGITYAGQAPRPTVASFERKRAARAERAVELTDRARSLEPDFAGARADIASRRARGESSVAKPVFAQPVGVPASPPVVPAVAAAPPAPGTLYHRGTLRGGQTLQQLGSIVVVGDVNPGAELVASGDIVVFGALRGTAHAGAQGDAAARVYALELAATQLRIAACIAAGDARRGSVPEVAFVEGDRITIAPCADMGGK